MSFPSPPFSPLEEWAGERSPGRSYAGMKSASRTGVLSSCAQAGGVARNTIDNPVTKWHHVVMEHFAEEPRERITARVSKRIRVTLEQAAELTGSTVNQFLVQSAYQEAQRLVERESVIRLSQEGARKVLALLDHPPKPNKRLKDAAKAFKSLVRA